MSGLEHRCLRLSLPFAHSKVVLVPASEAVALCRSGAYQAVTKSQALLQFGHRVDRGFAHDLRWFAGRAAHPLLSRSCEPSRLNDARLIAHFRAGIDRGDLVAIKEVGSTGEPSEPTSQQRRLVNQIHKRVGPTFEHGGRAYRLVAGADLAALRDRNSYEVTAHDVAKDVLSALATRKNGSEVAPFIAAAEKLLAPDWRPPAFPDGIVCLRRILARTEGPGSSAPAMTPSQMKALLEKAKPAHVAYLKFQYLDWPTPDAPVWKDLVADFQVQVLAGKTAGSASPSGGSAKTDAKGTCKVTLPTSLGAGEFVFFQLAKKDDAVGKLIPWPWSTFANRAVDGTLGRFEDVSADIASEGSPLVFRLGVYCEVPLTFNVGGSGLRIDYQLPYIGTQKVPEGTEVAIAQRFPGDKHAAWLDVFQYDEATKGLFRNAFVPSPRDPKPSGKNRQSAVPASLASPCGPGHVGQPGASDSYGFCCALTSKGGILRFLVSDLDYKPEDAKKSDIELTIFSRLHDTKYGTVPVEFTTSNSIGEIALNLLPCVDGSLDDRLSHTFAITRDVGARAAEVSDLKPPAQLVPDAKEELRAGIHLMKIGRLQNQIMYRLTGGQHRGVPGHRVKLIKATFGGQRPFCPPGLGVHLLYHPGDYFSDLWSTETAYTVAHERGHDIMWHELSVSFASLVWDFIGPGFLGADYVQSHGSYLETTPLTALYEGWADFCSMFTDWKDAPSTRGVTAGLAILPFEITMRDKSKLAFPPSQFDLDRNPGLYDLGERSEGVVSNFLWHISADICGLGTSAGQDYANGYVLAKFFTEEHIDEADFPQAKCDLFQKYIWRPFKYFWVDEKGQYHAKDHGDPSIRDFVNAIGELNRDAADQATVGQITTMAKDRMICKAQAVAYLEIQYKIGNGSWTPMTAGVRVEAWDEDPISADDHIGTATVDAGGKVVVYMPDKDENKPDIYFKIVSGKRNSDGTVGAIYWDTRKMLQWRYDLTGTVVPTTSKGFWNQFDKYQIGSAAYPVVFRIEL